MKQYFKYVSNRPFHKKRATTEGIIFQKKNPCEYSSKFQLFHEEMEQYALFFEPPKLRRYTTVSEEDLKF